jgi:hypothetical protein
MMGGEFASARYRRNHRESQFVASCQFGLEGIPWQTTPDGPMQ